MTVTDAESTEHVGPYAAAAAAYHRHGWAPLPIPFGRKKPVPDGWTGNEGAWPSFADVQAWIDTQGGGNVALRMPPHVLGVDVDNYGAKPGGAVIAQLEEQHGALPPTWRSTSRDDGVSGIRFYRVPEGLRWPGILGPGIETIRFAHRYAVAWPSVHPDTGGTYRWIGPDGVVQLGVPAVDELPAMPPAWVEALTGGALATDQARANLDDRAAETWLSGRAGAAAGPCQVMTKVLEQGMADLTAAKLSGASRHDAGLALTNRIVWLAGQGHTGLDWTLQQARAAFFAALAGEREDVAGEWNRMLTGAVRLAAAAHDDRQPDPCTNPFAGLIPKGTSWTSLSDFSGTSSRNPSSLTSSIAPGLTAGKATATSIPTAPDATLTTTETKTTTSAGSTADPEPLVHEPPREVVARLQLGGTFILDQPDRIPAVWGDGDAVLWAEGEALTICGPAGVGKTTLTGQVLRARLVGGEVLGLPVQPTAGRVLYLAMDRPRQIARALRRTLGDLPREVLDEKLVIWPGPPLADVAAHPETLVALVQLAGADTVIVDSIKDAAVGLSSDEVGAGYNRARQMCIAEGIEVLEQHHMVKKGEKGAKPNSLADLYGSVWIGAGAGSVLLLYGAAGDPIVQMTHLKTPADEVGPWRLIHDHDHGRTTIFHQTDALLSAQLAGPRGLTAKQLACGIAEKENPTEAEVEKARRQLTKLTDRGLLRVTTAAGQPSVWHFVEDLDGLVEYPVSPGLGGSRKGSRTHFEPNAHEGVTGSRSSSAEHDAGVTNGVTGVTHGGVTLAPSSLEEGGRARETRAAQQGIVQRSVAGEVVFVNLETGEVLDGDPNGSGES